MFGRLALLCLMVLFVGCSYLTGGQKRVKAPKWNPERAADGAMELCDADGDGLLSSKELAASPGLKGSLKNLDTDKDGKLSRDEILDRINIYVETRTGLQEFRCVVRYKGRPLPNASVRMVPEPFIEDKVGSAIGETRPDGQATMGLEDSLEPYMQPGIYRVEITSDTVSLPAKYNTETTLGCEVCPITSGVDQQEAVTFDLR